MKRITGLFLCLLIALSVVVFPTTASAATVVNKTFTQYKSYNLSFAKSESDEYSCKEANNDGNIKVDANNVGGTYWLTVKAVKVTKTKKPTITITDSKSGKEIKKFSIKVTAAKKIKVSNVKMNKGIWQDIRIKNPYDKENKISYNKKIIKFKKGGYSDEKGNWTYRVKGLKKGTTTVKVTLKGTSFVVNSFKITVGNYKASIKKAYKSSKLRYNKHICSKYLTTNGTINVGKAVKNLHSNSKITVKIKNTKIAKAYKVKKTETTPEAVKIYALKTGKTKANVYEKRGKTKKKIGTIKITVKQAKDAEVYEANRALDNDGIFYEFSVNVGDKINLKKLVTGKYINGPTGSKFKESEYKFSYTASPANVLSVDKSTGIFTILSSGSNKAGCTITFADGSKASCSGSFDIVNDSDDGSKSAVTGSWESIESPGTVYTFSEDGTGSLDMSGFAAKFTYVAKDNTVEITYDGNQSAQVYEYTVKDGVLSLKDKDTGTTIDYKKK